MSEGSKWSIRLDDLALRDLDGILDYLGAERFSAAESFIAKLDEVLELLVLSPFLGRVFLGRKHPRGKYRIMVVGVHLLLYTAEDCEVVIHRVVHGARDFQDLI